MFAEQTVIQYKLDAPASGPMVAYSPLACASSLYVGNRQRSQLLKTFGGDAKGLLHSIIRFVCGANCHSMQARRASEWANGGLQPTRLRFELVCG